MSGARGRLNGDAPPSDSGPTHAADGMIDHHVQPAQSRNRELHQGRDVIGIGHVAAPREDSAPVADFGGLDQVFQALLIDVASDHLSPLRCEPSGRGPAGTRSARPGHDHDFALKPHGASHWPPSPRFSDRAECNGSTSVAIRTGDAGSRRAPWSPLGLTTGLDEDFHLLGFAQSLERPGGLGQGHGGGDQCGSVDFPLSDALQRE